MTMAMQRKLKRAMDIAAALGLLVITAPIMAASAGLIYFTMGRPILFRQKRPGYREEIFELTKFRTMSNARDEQGELRPDAERMTWSGNFIRSLSIDELPQMWNVLKGDLSLIGPRPLLVEYLPLYSEDQHRRHNVPPGIVGWASVNGRNTNGWEKKFEFDLWYVDHWSLWLDLKIFFRAIGTVLSRSGINEQNQATASRFTGNRKEPRHDQS